MAVTPPRHEILLGLMARQGNRYLALCLQRRELNLPFDRGLHDWFCEYQALIHREYAAVVNEADNIIGKQYIKFSRPFEITIMNFPRKPEQRP